MAFQSCGRNNTGDLVGGGKNRNCQIMAAVSSVKTSFIFDVDQGAGFLGRLYRLFAAETVLKVSHYQQVKSWAFFSGIWHA